MPEAVLRVMAFDYGTLRHGIAVGNDLTATATPLTALPAKDGVPAWALLDELVSTWQPDVFLVGLPLEADLSYNTLSQRARKLARRLFGRYGKPCYAMNERGSTREAKVRAQTLGHRGNYREDPVDSLAAAIILETWLALRQASDVSPEQQRFLQPLAGPQVVAGQH